MRRRQALVALTCGAVGALGLLAAVELSLRHRLDVEQQRIERLKAAISLERRAASERVALETRMAQATSLLAEVNRIRRNNSTVCEWLAELPAQVPAGVRLASLMLDRPAWELRGVAGDLNRSAALLGQVRKMPMVSDVQIEQLQSNPDMTRTFVLAGQLGE